MRPRLFGLVTVIISLLSPFPAAASETLHYLHQDHLGSTALVTDDQGNVIGQEVYYPYGTTRNQLLDTGYPLTTRKYTGQVSDVPDTSLYYYNARYYSPTIAKFTSADTVQGPNRYTYVGNNPVVHTDPTGHQCEGSECTWQNWANNKPDGGWGSISPNEIPSYAPLTPEMEANLYTIPLFPPILVNYEAQYDSSGSRANFGTPWGLAANIRNIKKANAYGLKDDARYYTGEAIKDAIGTGLMIGAAAGAVRSLTDVFSQYKAYRRLTKLDISNNNRVKQALEEQARACVGHEVCHKDAVLKTGGEVYEMVFEPVVISGSGVSVAAAGGGSVVGVENPIASPLQLAAISASGYVGQARMMGTALNPEFLQGMTSDSQTIARLGVSLNDAIAEANAILNQGGFERLIQEAGVLYQIIRQQTGRVIHIFD